MIRKLFLFAAIFLAANVSYGQSRNVSNSNPANIIRALDNEWLTAYDRNDAKAIQRIFAENAQMIHSDGRLTVKSDELTNVKAAAPPELKANWRAEQIEVRFYGKTAISSGLAIQEGQYANQQFARKYRYTNVYVRRKKQWQLVSAQYSRIEK
jgi:ketosteroid isomerase-like protein